MPAANNPNTAPATAARRQIGDRTAAARLSDHGWTVIPPDGTALAELHAVLATAYETDGSGCDHGEPACSDCLADLTLNTLRAGRAL